MPTLSSIAILLLFCISLNACNARNIHVEMNERHTKQYLNKTNDRNAIIKSSPKVDPSLLNIREEAKTGSKVKQIRVNDNNQKQSDSDAIIEEMKAQRLLRSKDGVLRGHDSHVSVSFRVPRNNEGLDHHHPGFNLDYSPPKTHPPTHN